MTVVTSGHRALAHLRVLDCTASLGALCGKLLADLGADVVKVEPPGGSPLRTEPPFADGVEAPEASLGWWAHAAGCRSLVLDLASEAGAARFRALARAADVVIESFPPGHLDGLGLGWTTLSGDNPQLILTSVTPFGSAGPRCTFRAPELVLQAMSGMMSLVGDPDRPPVRIGGTQASSQAAGQALVGTLAALRERERTDRGQWVEVSAQAAMMWTMLSETALPPLHGYVPRRDGGHTRAARFRRRLIFPCRDGFVAMTVGGGVLGGAMMQALTAWMAEEGCAPASMRERDWIAWDTAYLASLGAQGQEQIDEVHAAVAAFVAGKTRAELYARAIAQRLLLAPLADAPDLLENEQLAARGFFASTPEPRLDREIVRPAAFAQLSATPLVPPRAAPRLGEGTAALDGEWAASPPRSRPGRGLAGLRVIDFAWVATGPITGRLLAELGADVIRVESARRLDPGRTIQPWAEGKSGVNRSQTFANANAGKRSVALDLSRGEARDLARQLIAGADVVVESFTPGTMARWGLDYASVRTIRPDLVYLSSCQQGQTGPHAQFRGYGSLAAGLAGFYTVTGWPDREPPMVYGAYTDFVAHHFASAAVLAALEHRARTGEGQHIDVSQLETGVHFLVPQILEYAVNGRAPGRHGNAHVLHAPHGVYPCAGHDRWCAIVCETDAEWAALGRVMGEPAWARDPRLTTAAGRKRAEAALDAALAEWTSSRDAFAVMETLQAAGVPAGVVQDCADLHRDPALLAREALVWIEHPEMGRTPYEALPFRLGGVPLRPRRAPCLGEHTDEVLREVLELSGAEIADLRAAGVLV